jgi:hypothetical protein
MDPKRPANKTYSEVMNEWAAQRHLVHANRSRLIHPPYDAHPVAKAVGYLGRLLVLLCIPAAGYIIALRQFGRSDAFNDEMSAGLAATLQARSADTKSAQWKMNGMLTIRALEAKGNDEAFYENLEAVNVGTRVPIPLVFHREWLLPRVSIEDLTIALRSGGKGKTATGAPVIDPGDDIRLPTLPGLVPTAPQDDTPAPRPAILPDISTGQVSPSPVSSAPHVMHAGYGISPNYASLRFLAVQTARLKASWGTSPATSGNIAGMQTDFTRNSTGWVISGDGGEFSQGWLSGLLVKKLAVTLSGSEASIDEVLFTRHGGGKAAMKGKLTYGEQPEITATLSLEGVRVQDFTAAETANLFDAEGSGTIQLSGSVNRTTGIRMNGSLTLSSGRVTGLPILKSLSQVTGEGQYRQLPVRSGSLEFSTSGSPEHGGQIVDITKLEVDLGPLARLRGSYREEQFRQNTPGQNGMVNEMVKASGLLQLGVPVSVAGKMKEALLERFFKPDNAGWMWMDLPVTRRLTSQFSKEAGQALLEAHNAL